MKARGLDPVNPDRGRTRIRHGQVFASAEGAAEV
jgi:hypothetical protein